MSIPSSPATFTLNSGNGWIQVCTFAIPAGAYLSGTWAYTGTGSGSLLLVGMTVNTAGGTVAFPNFVVVGANSDSVAAAAGQITDINAAAGGNLSVTLILGASGTGALAVSAFTLTLVATSVGPPPPPPKAIDAWQPRRYEIIQARKLDPVHLAVPVVPVDSSVSSAPVVMSFRQEAPGGILITNNASSSSVRMTFKGGGGSESNGSALSTSSRPEKMTFTTGATADTTALQTGNLKFSMNRDNRGAVWTTEHAVASGVDANSSGAAWLGNRWGVLYSIAGQVYWKTSTDPDDWTVTGPITLTGITGRVYGLARNQLGAMCAMVGKVPVVSRDNGATWHASATVSAVTLPCSIVAKNHLFIITCPVGKTVTHFVSKDGGDTFT